jgi:NAD(P)-dependent dehydrogenase (short-subunit alcohol dehydrogenase family)
MENPTIPRRWNQNNLPDLTGKKFLITGGTSGLGLSAARELVKANAQVVFTARSENKAQSALNQISAKSNSRISYLLMDLTDLSSVKAAANEAAQKFDGAIDCLILNAGVMATPFTKTKDGFELQMGTNHLGHFAFAGLLKGAITERIISISSQAHRMGSFGDNSTSAIKRICLGTGKYSPWAAYGASKLANLLFVSQIERLRIKNNWRFIPLAAHPGYSDTNLQSVAPQMKSNKWEERTVNLFNSVIAQSADKGALPMLCAATFPGLIGASYLGPDGFMEMRGYPKLTRGKALAYDQTLAENLWQVSEELTGVKW